MTLLVIIGVNCPHRQLHALVMNSMACRPVQLLISASVLSALTFIKKKTQNSEEVSGT
jgi:hypothetical protein